MKALLATALLFAATCAHAIPIQTLDFSQDNWSIFLDYRVTDSATGSPYAADSVYLNGQLIGNDVSGIAGFATIPQTLGTGGIPERFLIFGENQFTITDNGVSYDGPTFTLSQPTGDRPITQPVPELGNTALLLLAGLAAISRFRVTD